MFMTDSSRTHDTPLIKQAFLDEEGRRIRQNIDDEYTIPEMNFLDWMLKRQRSWRGDERVLDISSTQDIQGERLNENFSAGSIITVDLARHLAPKTNQLVSHDKPIPVAKLQQLPFPDDSFDVVIANHILYYVSNADAVIADLHRVLKPEGVLLASTDSQFTMAEFSTLARRALTLLGHPTRTEDSYFGQLVEEFSLENGATKLARHFRAVVRHEIPSTFIFSDPEPIIKYINTNRKMREHRLPEGVSWEDFMSVMSDQIRRLINHFGELTVNKLAGVHIATDKGGFAKEYFAALENPL
jgi:ubiquinone/menaquinone biosynthesis C-methylase UbiE